MLKHTGTSDMPPAVTPSTCILHILVQSFRIHSSVCDCFALGVSLVDLHSWRPLAPKSSKSKARKVYSVEVHPPLAFLKLNQDAPWQPTCCCLLVERLTDEFGVRHVECAVTFAVRRLPTQARDTPVSGLVLG